jgi:hypothetical protein
MCQLVRCRIKDRIGFREVISRIPRDAWIPTHEDHTRDGNDEIWTTLAALDVLRERGAPLEPLESLEAELIPVFFGPGATVHAKLMAADLRCSALAAGAIGAVRAGEGSVDAVAAKTGLSPKDLMTWQPPFSPPYAWFLIRRREDARSAVERLYPRNEAAIQWAAQFGVGSLAALLAKTQPGIPPKMVSDTE